MICINCNSKKKIKPLILFNGELACNYCGKSLIASEETVLEINEVNHALLLKSEKIFATEWLTKEHNKRDKSMLKKALHYCRDSANLNNPYAIINLAYYYENGYFEDFNLSQRLLISSKYYSSVCFNVNDKIIINGNKDNTLSYEEHQKLVKLSVFNLKDLFEEDNLSDIVGSFKTNKIESKIQNVCTKFNINLSEYQKVTNSKFNFVNKEEVYINLFDYNTKKSEYLFGIYKFSKNEINNLKSNEKYIKSIKSCIESKNKTLIVHKVNGNGELILSESNKKINNFRQIETLNAEGNEKIFIYFYNNKNYKISKQLFSKANRSKIDELLMKSSVDFLWKDKKTKELFKEDDIEKYLLLYKNEDQAIKEFIKDYKNKGE